jgi:uncharacterized coiled-coil protein SlyX
MTMLDTLQSLSGGPMGYAALVGAITLSLRALPGIARRALAVWAAIRAKREEVALERERRERAEVEVDAMHVTITAEQLQRYEARLTATEARAERAERRVEECERRHVERERLVADLRETVAEQAGEIAKLRERVDRLTPEPFKAVKEKR